MNKHTRIFATSIVVFGMCGTPGGGATQNSPAFISKYGEIQSVNKYSSNPFWTPNSPYNQRFPTPVYVTGADLTTGDCNRIVQNLISLYCSNYNNCSNLRISDVRPNIMVQLSQLPGHNFATSCGGYIDSIFEDYKKTYGNSSTNNIVKPAQQKQTTIQIDNPFKQQLSEYDQGVAERTAELERLQNITTPRARVTATEFPKTIDDLSFTDRLANTTAGYEPYKNLNAYKTPNFETEDQYYERMKSVLEHDIHYIGAGASGCPAKYLTGRGATVSCTPTLQNGTCTAWCTDAAKTNCATMHTISPNDRDDKTFYAKCTCNAGYEEQNNKCVRPGTSGGGNNNGGGIGPNPNPNTNTCTDPAYMDANCACTVVPNTHEESGKCVCDNGGDIGNNCQQTDPANGETYALLSCQVRPTKLQDSIYLGTGKTMKKPGTDLQCYISADFADGDCFLHCNTDSTNHRTGYLNNIIEPIVNKDVCVGRLPPEGTDDEFFVSEFKRGNITPALLNSIEVNKIKTEINNNMSTVQSYCKAKRHHWRLYILKKTTSGEWIAVDAVTLN